MFFIFIFYIFNFEKLSGEEWEFLEIRHFFKTVIFCPRNCQISAKLPSILFDNSGIPTFSTKLSLRNKTKLGNTSGWTRNKQNTRESNLNFHCKGNGTKTNRFLSKTYKIKVNLIKNNQRLAKLKIFKKKKHRRRIKQVVL